MDTNSASDIEQGRSSGGGGDGDGRISGGNIDTISYITKVLPNDVLANRGPTDHKHPGNVQFRKLVSNRMAEYDKSERKGEIFKSIAMSVSENNGRFLRKVVTLEEAKRLGVPSGTTAWVLMDERTVIKKIRMAFYCNSKGVAQFGASRTNSLPGGSFNADGPFATNFTGVTPLDVLASFDKAGLDPYPSNRQFHLLLASEKQAFSAAETSELKWQIAETVVFRVYDRNGLFLRKIDRTMQAAETSGLLNSELGVWVPIEHSTAIELTLHELRSLVDGSTHNEGAVGETTQEIRTLSPAIQPAQEFQSPPNGVVINVTLLVEFDEYSIFRISFVAANKTAFVQPFGAGILAMTTFPPGLSELFPWCPVAAGVYNVWPGTLAERAGLCVCDVLCSVDWDTSERSQCPDVDDQDASKASATATGNRGFASGMRLMTKSEFKQDLLRSQQDGLLTLCIARRRSVRSVADELVKEKRALDSADAAGSTNAEQPRSKQQRILTESISVSTLVEQVVGAQASPGDDARLPVYGGPAIMLDAEGDEVQTDKGVAEDVTVGNDDPMKFSVEETADVSGTSLDILDVELDSSSLRNNQEQARLQGSDVASNTETRNGQESSHATREHESATSMALSKTTDNLPTTNVNRAAAPIFFPAAKGRSLESGGEASAERIQQELAPTGQTMPASRTEDLEQDDKELALCIVKHPAASSNTTTGNHSLGVNRADEPRDEDSIVLPAAAAADRTLQSGREPTSEEEEPKDAPAVSTGSKVHVQTGKTSPPDLADTTMEDNDDSEWEKEGLAMCQSELVAIRECNKRLLTQHYQLHNEIQSLWNDPTMATELSSEEAACLKSRPKPLVRPPPPPKDAEDLETLWCDWYTSLDDQNEQLLPVIECQQEQVEGLRLVKEQSDQSKAKAEKQLQLQKQLEELQKESEQLDAQARDEENKLAELKKAALASLSAEY